MIRLEKFVRAAVFGGLLLAGGMAAGSARSQETASIDPTQSRADYDIVLRDMTLSADRAEALAAEIQALRKDHATITAALIQSAKTEKKLSEDIEAITARLGELDARSEILTASLRARRGVLAEVLGALQRIGLNPPPAILVKPEDALASVRSAILLSAVVPELRGEAEILIADLEELSRLSTSISEERQRLGLAIGEQLSEKERLALLLEEKQRLRGDSETALADERARSAGLATKARSLQELIASLEKQADEKRKAEAEAARAREAESKHDDMLASLPVPRANQLSGGATFGQLQRQIALPVVGRIERGFGERDHDGGVMQGDMLATQSGAIVSAPSDGQVLYAGPFRSYGQLLILDAGDGYHLVLAGMGRISVSQAQVVLAGEPVGVMRTTSVAGAGVPDEIAQPKLYIEFRKDGKPVDPAPWWADRLTGGAANDT